MGGVEERELLTFIGARVCTLLILYVASHQLCIRTGRLGLPIACRTKRFGEKPTNEASN